VRLLVTQQELCVVHLIPFRIELQSEREPDGVRYFPYVPGYWRLVGVAGVPAYLTVLSGVGLHLRL